MKGLFTGLPVELEAGERKKNYSLTGDKKGEMA